MAAATGGILSFFGGAKEAQDQSMRDTMQRESAEELVLISKHGRPSRQPIHYGAQIATVTLFKYEIHLFVAQIEAEVDVVPSESERTKTAGVHWLPLAALLSPIDPRLMPSSRLMAACIANIPSKMLNDLLRPLSSLRKQSNPRGWRKQQQMRQSRITCRSDRRTVSAYLHGHTTIASSEGPTLTTFAAAEDELVSWLHRCAAGRMKLCDVWELLSFSAHQIRSQHVDSQDPGNVTVANSKQEESTATMSVQDFIWYVSDFRPANGGMWVSLRQNLWLQSNPGNTSCVFATSQGQSRVGHPLESIYVGDAVRVVFVNNVSIRPFMAIIATNPRPFTVHPNAHSATV